MTHWPRSWNYPEENEDDEMSSMGRACAEHEEKLLLKQNAAEEMYEALKKVLVTMNHIIADDESDWDFGKGWGGSYDLVIAALAKAEGRS